MLIEIMKINHAKNQEYFDGCNLIKTTLSIVPLPLGILSTAIFTLLAKQIFNPAVSICISTSLGGATTWGFFKMSNYTTQKISESLLYKLEQKIKKCDSTRLLIEKAKKKVLRVYGKELSINTKSNFLAIADCSDNGEITVDSNMSEAFMQSSLIFELANATQSKLFKALNDQAKRNSISQEEYAFQTEQVEWQSARIAKSTLEQARLEQPNDWSEITISDACSTLIELENDAARWEWMNTHMQEHVNGYRTQYEMLKGSPVLKVL